MRIFLLLCLFALTSCNLDNGVQRNYIISQTAEEAEEEAE
jgi:hypothetical protein